MTKKINLEMLKIIVFQWNRQEKQ